MAITFTATGIPRPQPRPRVFRGRAVSTADPKARAWSDAIVRAASPLGRVPLGDVPLAVTMLFRFPTKDSKRHGLPHTFVPDADNLAKLALDALQRSGTLANDSAVSLLSVRKVWCASPLAGATFLLSEDQERVPFGGGKAPAWLAGGLSGAGEGQA